MKNKLIKIGTIIFTFLLLILTLAENVHIVDADASLKSICFLSESGFELSSETTSTSNTFKFKIKLEGTQDTTYSVRVKSYDGTLIEQAKDYDQLDVTLYITTSTSGSGESSTLSLDITTSQNYVVGDTSNYFNLKIESVNGSSLSSTDNFKTSLKVNVSPTYKFEQTYKDSTYGNIISAYDYRGTDGASFIGDDKIYVGARVNKTATYNLNVVHNDTTLNNLAYSGIASYYVGILGLMSSQFNGKYPQAFSQISMYNSTYHFNNSDPLFTSYYGTSYQAWFSDNITPGGYQQNYTYSTRFSIDEDIFYNDIKTDMPYFLTNDDVALYKINTYYLDSLLVSFYNGSKYIAGSQGDEMYYQFKNWRYKLLLSDTIAPEIENAYILNNDSQAYKDGDKLKIAIRLSEPCQLLNLNSEIYAYYSSDKYFTLKYSYGVGTNTLVYELDSDYDVNINATTINRLSFSTNTTIRDYSYTGNLMRLSGIQTKSSVSVLKVDLSESYVCNLSYKVDTRTPSVEVINTNNTTLALQSNDLKITIENASEGFSFKYALLESEDEIASNFIDITDFKFDGTNSKWIYTLTVGDGLNGKYYFYYEATSSYGLSRNNKGELKELNFDNTPPDITDFTYQVGLSDTGQSDYTKYNFSFNIIDNPNGIKNNIDKIDSLQFVYSESPLRNKIDLNYITLSTLENPKLNITDDAITFTINASLVGVDAEDIKYKDLYVGLVAVDAAGNMFGLEDTEEYYIRFDTRNMLSGTGNITGDLINNFNKVYSLSSTPTLTYTASISDSVTYTNYNFKVYKYGQTTKDKTDITDTTNNSAYYDFELDDKTYTIKFKQSGYYSVQFDLDDSLFSEEFSFYVGSGSDKTDNYQTIQYPINKVYSTNLLKFYYYGESEINCQYYNNVNLSQMFSSEYLRDEYLKYYEYLDMYAIKISASQASSLNLGQSQTYKKAQGETTKALAGQIWIRYKKSDWSFSTDTSDWVYYYYGDYSNTNININYLNKNTNLKTALNCVVDTIAQSCGGAVYLVSDDSTEAIVPTLEKSQVHVNEEKLSETKLGNKISNATFVGDSSIYSSYYIDGENSYYFYSNATFSFGSFTKLYIKKLDGTEEEYLEISATNSGVELKDILKNSKYGKYDTGEDKDIEGKYQIIEIDSNGVSIINVYVVGNAPEINVSFKNSDGTYTNFSLSNSSNGETFRTQSFSLNGFATISGYNDPYSFIEVINNSTSAKAVYYKSDLTSPKELSDGSYTIVVSDRFKNQYVFVVTVNSTKTDFTLTVSDNEYVRFTCSLASEDVFSFDVKLNGISLKATYAETLTFKESGTYVITLVDIYGQTISKTCDLFRETPNVNWLIALSDSYQNASEASEGFVLNEVNSTLYYIYSNQTLAFSFSGDYKYTFDYDLDYKESEFLSTKRITLSEACSFTVKICYSEFESNSITYIVINDQSAPNVEAYTKSYDYTFNDYVKLANGPTDGLDIISDIGYSKANEENDYIANGGQTYSSSITLNASDATSLKDITIKLNGEIIYSSESDTTFTSDSFKYTLTKLGSYEICAHDELGNETNYSFKNQLPDYYNESIDFKESKSNLDVEASYKTIKYGHSEVEYKINNFQTFALLINNTVYYFKNTENELYVFYYKPIYINAKYQYESFSQALLENISSEYALTSLELEGLKLYIKYVDDYFYLDFKVDSSDVVSIKTRLISNFTNNPFYSNVELYSVASEIEFDTNDGTISFDDYLAYIHSSFSICDKIDSNIEKIEYAAKSDDELIYEELNISSLKDLVFGTSSGTYYFRVTNKYNNITLYTIELENILDVNLDMIYKDGTTISYTYEGDTTYYSNNESRILVYNTSATIKVLKDNVEIEISKTITDFVSFTISGAGNYRVEISDKYKNDRSFNLYISESEFNVDNSIFYDLNDEALRKDELYTNGYTSIDTSLIAKLNIYYISYRYNNTTEENVLYDNISQTKVIPESLDSIIGLEGNGIYNIIFRDLYGNVCVRQVHYYGSPTLDILRKTRVDEAYNFTDVDDEYCVYSNDYLKFETVSTVYNFTINGTKQNLPYTLKFPTGTVSGEYKYEITYLDEYGFRYEFKAILLREEIETEISIDTKTIDGVTTVNKDFSINFDTQFTSTYKFNNETYTYKSNELIHTDGLYAFTISDKAGNTKNISIKKDSIVSFIAKESLTDREVISGDVSNNGNVIIKSSLDGEYVSVKKAYLNGVSIDNPGTTFNDDGKYEMILTDEVGNEIYFMFYIYTSVLKSFSYDSPYNYIITKLDYTDRSGTKVTYLENVIQHDSYSSVSLVDDGTYNIVMTSNANNNIVSFSIEISDIKPNVELVGVENHGSTSNNVTIKGYEVGDVIRIYKDNVLTKTVNVTSSDISSPEINEVGDYRIEVTNTQGNTTVLEFTREYTANGASSILIVVILCLIACALFAGMFLRKREKID